LRLFHKIVEDEFYEVEDFRDIVEFKAKAYAYQLYFNYKRKNRWRGRMSPYEILISEGMNPGVLDLPPPILEDFWDLFKDENAIGGGYLVGNAVR